MLEPRSVIRVLFATCMTASLCACVPMPALAPSFTVLPKQGETFDVFQKHDSSCRSYASGAAGEPSAQQAQSDQMASAAVGATVGAAAGALIGSSGGQAGSGAAFGAGTGLIFGSIVGQQQGQQVAANAQQRYDSAYAQCMASYGELLPAPTPVPPRTIYVLPVPPPVVVYPAYPAG